MGNKMKKLQFPTCWVQQPHVCHHHLVLAAALVAERKQTLHSGKSRNALSSAPVGCGADGIDATV
jgi:hypothetical protein